MNIEPIIQGVVAKSAHPLGCEQSVRKQIEYVKQSKSNCATPKRILVIGGSSGFGLASRIALAFGNGQADTISVSMERAPSKTHSGSAGWYNDYYFKKYAEREGKIAVNIHGDAFSQSVKDEVIEAVETYFEGEVDLVIYSVASGKRVDERDEKTWYSSIAPMSSCIEGYSFSFESDELIYSELPPATAGEILATKKVMGGEDWEAWIDALINADSVAEGCQTVAFSYVGPELTHPIYLDGTLGHAKIDLHQTSHSLNLKLAHYGGAAHASVCKALVTKASVFIPTLGPYLAALYKVMKQQGTHEGCIEQMVRLFNQKMYQDGSTVTDSERLIRIDEFELDQETQQQVELLLNELTPDNFERLSDYQGIKQEFLALNGFAHEEVNYAQSVDMAPFIKYASRFG